MQSKEIITAPKANAIISSDVFDSSFVCGALSLSKMDKISGVYKIESKELGICYVGSSTDMYKRKSDHLYLLKRLSGSNRLLAEHVNIYGFEDLEFTIILLCDKSKLLQYEQYYIDNSNSKLNISKTAGKNTGVKYSEEVKDKISRNRKGKQKGEMSYVWEKEARKFLGMG